MKRFLVGLAWVGSALFYATLLVRYFPGYAGLGDSVIAHVGLQITFFHTFQSIIVLALYFAGFLLMIVGIPMFFLFGFASIIDGDMFE